MTILATGFEEESEDELAVNQSENYFESLISKLYKPYKRQLFGFTPQPIAQAEEPEEHGESTDLNVPFTVEMTVDEEEFEDRAPQTAGIGIQDDDTEAHTMTFKMNEQPIIKQEHKASLLSKAKALMNRISDLTQED